MNAISLFSGCGGQSLGIEYSGLKVIAHNEKTKIFRKTHDLNFTNSKLIGNNITKISNKTLTYYKNKIKLLACAFSYKDLSTTKNTSDAHNILFKHFIRAIKCIEPDYILCESVKGLLSKKNTDNKKYTNTIRNDLNSLGYNVKYKLLKCHLYNIPQKKDRFIILGVKKTINTPLYFPNTLSTHPNLLHIVKFNMTGAIKINPKQFNISSIPKECILCNMNNNQNENNPHPYLKLLVNDNNFTYQNITYSNRISFAKRDSPIHAEIIDIRYPSKTITSTYKSKPRLFVLLKNKNGYFLRCLLPSELKQIQGFPIDYKIYGNKKQQITQICNAASPPLIKQIIDHLQIL